MRKNSEKKSLCSWSNFFDFHNVPGDGNCFLYALLKASQPDTFLNASNEELHTEALTLRHQIADYIEKNQNNFNGFIYDEISLAVALAGIRTDGAWCGQLEIAAAAAALKLNIVVISRGNPAVTHGEDPDRPTVYLAYNGIEAHGHYAALIPKSIDQVIPRYISCDSTLPWEGETASYEAGPLSSPSAAPIFTHAAQADKPPPKGSPFLSAKFLGYSTLFALVGPDVVRLITEYADLSNPDNFNDSLYAVGTAFMTLKTDELDVSKRPILGRMIEEAIKNLVYLVESAKNAISRSKSPAGAIQLAALINKHTDSLKRLRENIMTANIQVVFTDLLALATELDRICFGMYARTYPDKSKKGDEREWTYNAALFKLPEYIELYFQLLPFLIAQRCPELLGRPTASEHTKERFWIRSFKLIQVIYEITKSTTTIENTRNGNRKKTRTRALMYFFTLLSQFTAPVEQYADVALFFALAHHDASKQRLFQKDTLSYLEKALEKVLPDKDKKQAYLMLLEKLIRAVTVRNAMGEVYDKRRFLSFSYYVLTAAITEFQRDLYFPIEAATIELLILTLMRHCHIPPFKKLLSVFSSKELPKDASDRHLLWSLILILIKKMPNTQDFLDSFFAYLTDNKGAKLKAWVKLGFSTNEILKLFSTQPKYMHFFTIFKNELEQEEKRQFSQRFDVVPSVDEIAADVVPNVDDIVAAEPSQVGLFHVPDRVNQMVDEPENPADSDADSIGVKRFVPSKLKELTENERTILSLFDGINDLTLKKNIIELFESADLNRSALISFRDELNEEEQQAVKELLNNLLGFFPKLPSGGMISARAKKESPTVNPENRPDFAKLAQILQEPAAKRPRR